MTEDTDTDTDIDTDIDSDTETYETDGSGGAELVEADVDELQERVGQVRTEVGKRIVGQRDVVEQLLVCVVADGNALLESNPGLGKTTLVRTLADATNLSFSRIQNTPDLMPSDITGTEIIQESGDHREFVFEKGPIFANVVLADEINRATPKTQAAMLEAMQEKQVTAAGETYQLPRPFFVLATQNPIDQGGTYPLPEAQTDRFLLKILVDYPARDEERDIVRLYAEGRQPETVDRVLSAEELRAVQALARDVPVADDIRDRAIDLARATREDDRLEFGASPRASMALVLTGKARAFIEGRSHVSWDDIEAMAAPVLRHRVILDFSAEREGLSPDDVIADLVDEA